MKNKILLLTVYTFWMLQISSCATSATSDVPTLNEDKVHPISFKGLEKTKINLFVSVKRSVNIVSKNAHQVEAALRKIETTALNNGGHSVGASKYLLEITAEDCHEMLEGEECVVIAGNFKGPFGTLKVRAQGSQHYVRGNRNIGFGDVSEAYGIAINTLNDHLVSEWNKKQ